MIGFIVIGLIIFAIVMIYEQLKSSNSQNRVEESSVVQQTSTQLPPKVKMYCQKRFLTDSENNFYNILKELEVNYKIIPQINLATIIHKEQYSYQNELYRNIDFAIFTKDYSELLLLIELNDKSHNEPKRKRRDHNVKDICTEAGINLMTFYTNMPNERNYVLNRILTQIQPKVIQQPIQSNNNFNNVPYQGNNSNSITPQNNNMGI